MNNIFYLFAIFLLLLSCNENKTNFSNIPKKEINSNLPTIGLLIYDGVLITEVTATADVFTKKTLDGKQLFNVIVIAEKLKPVVTEEGVAILPDVTFENTPKLEALFVPSAYDMSAQVQNKKIGEFKLELSSKRLYLGVLAARQSQLSRRLAYLFVIGEPPTLPGKT